ncbi:NAD(P)-dependent oxidoreductase [Magnetospira sp. QH-2]|uniref:SDR family oxidoreductase n=1 Tax=Magnetospira sp. (strain QH-2) TaxID=1288970 RepID=UPI0003E81989|nr:NAD(P)-dependent oxidoreductase [Magnetospira sp. QH-2]CCQ75633.1 dTDP-4-dehydrorhamnose reductase [Magnetospira sp. QH-2]
MLKPSLSDRPILITGASGMLGRAFGEVLKKSGPVMALSHQELDVTDRQAVMDRASDRPAWIIHCAADVNAERCEIQPQETRRIQVGGAENIAALAVATGARVLYPQSFLIFDGAHLPIDESTPPNPLSVYGRCKWEAETLLRDRLGDHALCVRMAGFFGGEEKDKNFVGKFLPHVRGLLARGETSYAVGDRVWQPTWTVDLARNSLLLMAEAKSGLYTMGCEGEASFFDLATACMEELGLSRAFTVTRASEQQVAGNEKAKRPPRAVLQNTRLRADGLDRMRPWRTALKEYLARPYFKDMFKEYADEAA